MGRLGRAMSEASRFWSNQEGGNAYAGNCFDLLTRANALSWLTKDRWTVWEGACLLSGFDPDACRTSFFDLEIGQIIYDSISDITPNLMRGKTHQEAKNLADQSNVHFYQLLGCVAKYTGRDDLYNCVLNLSFPVKAFFGFGVFVYFPNKKYGQNLPCFGIFHDLEAETKAASHYQLINKIEKIEPDFKQALDSLGLFTEEKDAYSGYELELVQEVERVLLTMVETTPEEISLSSNPAGQDAEDIAPWDLPLERDKPESNYEKQKASKISQSKCELSDTQTIIEGLPVTDVRQLFDEKHPRARAELRAAVELWASFESKPVPNGLTTMQEIKLRLADWEVEHDCEFLESERKRVCVMVNWDKDGNKQKPKKR